MGSRFGGGIKQLEPVGPNGEIIMDYSIHDAIEEAYEVKEIQPVDMFPFTGHVECVAVLQMKQR